MDDRDINVVDFRQAPGDDTTYVADWFFPTEEDEVLLYLESDVVDVLIGGMRGARSSGEYVFEHGEGAYGIAATDIAADTARYVRDTGSATYGIRASLVGPDTVATATGEEMPQSILDQLPGYDREFIEVMDTSWDKTYDLSQREEAQRALEDMDTQIDTGNVDRTVYAHTAGFRF